MKRRDLAIISFAVLALSGIVYQLTAGTTEATREAPTLPAGPQDTAEATYELPLVREPAAPPPERADDTPLGLKEFWGTRWPQVREEIVSRWGEEALAEKLSQKAPSWEAVQQQIHDEVVVPPYEVILDNVRKLFLVELDDDALKRILRESGASTDEVQLGIMRSVRDDYEGTITDAVLLVVDREIQYRKRIWDQKLYHASPFFSVGRPERFEDSGPGFVQGTAMNGWCISIVMPEADDPDFLSARNALRERLAERKAALVEAAGNL